MLIEGQIKYKMSNINNGKPGLFGITCSNRDFSQAQAWGKNQFNSSFPASLASFLAHKGFENIYLYLDKDMNVCHGKISTESLFGISPQSGELFFSFEAQYTPYQRLVIGTLPRVDLVTQSRSDGLCLRPIEIKLTALPDNSTCSLSDNLYGCEIVVRPDTIVYLACSIAEKFINERDKLDKLIGNKFDAIYDFTDADVIIPYINEMVLAVDRIILAKMDHQSPLLMQPIWKTEGKSPRLAKQCLDVFVWSNFAFTRLFIGVAKIELLQRSIKITRQIRSLIWLFKMLYDFSKTGQIDHRKTIDELSYNTKNDKAFSVNGKVTHKYMNCVELENPRIPSNDIRKIILGGGQDLLSPERRFDAIICNSSDLFG